MATSASRPSPPKPHERARGLAQSSPSIDDALIPSSGRNQLVRSARDTLDLNRENFGRGMDRDFMTPYERERSLASGLTGGYSSLHNSSPNGVPPRVPPRSGFLSDTNRPLGSSFGGSSSLYGGSSMYGGGMYNRGYGMGGLGMGGYGSSMYGGGLGYGGGGLLNPYSRDPKFLSPYDTGYGYGVNGGMGGYVSNSFGWVHDFQSLVQTFAQISWLLDANFETLGGAFGSMFRFLTRARSVTATELTPIVQVLLFFSALGVAGAKLTQFLRGTAGRAALQSGDDLAAFEHFATKPAAGAASTALRKSPLRRYAWLMAILVLIGTMFGAPMLVSLLARVFRRGGAAPAAAAADAGSDTRPAMRVRALYDFEGETRDDLAFRRGDVIEVLEQRGQWLEGRSLETGRVGLVPLNFVRPIAEERTPRSADPRDSTASASTASESLRALDLGSSLSSSRGVPN